MIKVNVEGRFIVISSFGNTNFPPDIFQFRNDYILTDKLIETLTEMLNEIKDESRPKERLIRLSVRPSLILDVQHGTGGAFFIYNVGEGITLFYDDIEPLLQALKALN